MAEGTDLQLDSIPPLDKQRKLGLRSLSLPQSLPPCKRDAASYSSASLIL